ncbi:hypothetical protein [Actinokineospora sp. HUAS TT18]|uniref:hypothetical protein n=1 Tax=Actinokineospora sp. HUAS TT18 TaxID=3447451 RepID=UPI003F528DD9
MLITDGTGIPLAAAVTGGNRDDTAQLTPLIEAVPPGAWSARGDDVDHRQTLISGQTGLV